MVSEANTQPIKKAKKPATHPTYSEMIVSAVGALKGRGGSSRSAILKYLKSNYDVGTNDIMVNAHVKMALKNGVTSGALVQVKGTGASGSFKLGDKAKKDLAPKKSDASVKSAKTTTKKTTKPKTVVKSKPSKTNNAGVKKTPSKGSVKKTPSNASQTVKKTGSKKKVVKTPTKKAPAAKKEKAKSASKKENVVKKAPGSGPAKIARTAAKKK